MKMFYEVDNINLSDAEVLECMRVKTLAESDRYLRDYGHSDMEQRLWYDDGSAFTTWFKGDIREFFASKPREEKKQEPEDRTLWHAAHKVNNTIVWLNGDRAIAELMCVLMFRFKMNGDWFDGETYGRMHYRAEKRNGKWGLVHFTGMYEWDRMDPVFHDCEVKIPREEILKFRNSNFYMAYRQYMSSGSVLNHDQWPGPDRPETIQALYEDSSKWFFEKNN